jgi:NAD(P)-dependent dehydrogenase (short-subunit alcohol dehydrogenase family)
MKAYVTGGSRGIGRAVADALIARGDDVVAGSRQDGDVGEDPAGLVDRAADALGGLDIFVACAVEPIRRPILELTADDFDRTMRVNARPFVLGAIAAARHMAPGGRIVAVSSTGTHRVRNRAYAPLALAKGAVEAAVRFLAVELAEQGITVNAVAPGPTNTEAFEAMGTPSPPTLRERLVATTPMGRMGEPADAARLIAWLCSPEAGWVTGQLIFSDGGYLLA